MNMEKTIIMMSIEQHDDIEDQTEEAESSKRTYLEGYNFYYPIIQIKFVQLWHFICISSSYK